MALATRCPACETIFRISTAQAAAKGGMVRCGQCRHVFNSLDALIRVEDLDVMEENGTDAVASPPDPASIESGSHGVDASEGASTAPNQPIEEVGEPQRDADAVVSSSARKQSEGAVKSAWWLPQNESVESRPASTPESPKPTVNKFKERSLSDRRVSIEWPRSKDREPEFLRSVAPRAERSRTERWMLAVLSIIAAVGLTAQAAYVWRNELAARWPASKPWLVAVCAPLRCAVNHPAHIDSITIESAALQSSGPNSNLYTLTALLRNRDAVTVRYPHLELTLTDTQDRPILRRALRPEDYLVASRDAAGKVQGGIAAESELPVRMMFDLADLRFVGYRLDKFYP